MSIIFSSFVSISVMSMMMYMLMMMYTFSRMNKTENKKDVLTYLL